jgi:hypothetical protein
MLKLTSIPETGWAPVVLTVAVTVWLSPIGLLAMVGVTLISWVPRVLLITRRSVLWAMSAET